MPARWASRRTASGKVMFSMQHEKLEDVAAVAAAEALEHLLAGIDEEGGRFFLVERAERLVFRARFFQRHVAADHVDDVAGVAHLLDDFGGNHAGHGQVGG